MDTQQRLRIMFFKAKDDDVSMIGDDNNDQNSEVITTSILIQVNRFFGVVDMKMN